MNTRHVEQLVQWLNEEFEDRSVDSHEDFLQGVEAFAEAFSICRNGERYFGLAEYTTRELSEAITIFRRERGDDI